MIDYMIQLIRTVQRVNLLVNLFTKLNLGNDLTWHARCKLTTNLKLLQHLAEHSLKKTIHYIECMQKTCRTFGTK